MAGPRQPTSLVKQKGKKHLSKAEIAAREAGEVTVPTPTTGEGSKIRAPAWLPAALREEFNELRGQLVEIGIFSRLDRDTLGRYLVARSQWLDATEQVQAALARKDVESATEWSTLQDRFFKQARNCATDLGLTVTSRCRLVIPQKPNGQEDNPLEALMRKRELGNSA